MPSRLPMSRGFVRSVLPRVFDGDGGGGGYAIFSKSITSRNSRTKTP